MMTNQLPHYSPSTSSTTSSDPDPNRRLLDLTDRTGYQLVQRNGQRIYGNPPPNWVGPAPENGCEVFVGKVPRDCYEDELVPLFEQAGLIYELRLMMDFSGSNRGYLFVRYTNRQDAVKAVNMFNNYELRPSKFIGVVHSVDNRKLMVHGVPLHHGKEKIQNAFEDLTPGVRDLVLLPNDKSATIGNALVEYESHRAAALARRKLVPGNNLIEDHEIGKVDWADPEQDWKDKENKVLFVRGLLMTTTEAKVKSVFELICSNLNDDKNVQNIMRVRKIKNYAFVHFYSKEVAKWALERSAFLSIDNVEVQVKWSEPVEKNHCKNQDKMVMIPKNPLANDWRKPRVNMASSIMGVDSACFISPMQFNLNRNAPEFKPYINNNVYSAFGQDLFAPKGLTKIMPYGNPVGVIGQPKPADQFPLLGLNPNAPLNPRIPCIPVFPGFGAAGIPKIRGSNDVFKF